MTAEPHLPGSLRHPQDLPLCLGPGLCCGRCLLNVRMCGDGKRRSVRPAGLWPKRSEGRREAVSSSPPPLLGGDQAVAVSLCLHGCWPSALLPPVHSPAQPPLPVPLPQAWATSVLTHQGGFGGGSQATADPERLEGLSWGRQGGGHPGGTPPLPGAHGGFLDWRGWTVPPPEAGWALGPGGQTSSRLGAPAAGRGDRVGVSVSAWGSPGAEPSHHNPGIFLACRP